MQEVTTGLQQFEYDNISTNKVEARVGPKQLLYEGYPEKATVFAYLEKKSKTNIDPVWKVHISLLEDTENIRAAWNLIKDILINYEIDASKILRKNCYYPEFQLGKEITIYDQPRKFNWQKMLNEITLLLNKHNIKPGFTPINDKPIKGSSFFSFRCDLDENNRKVSSLQASSYKPPQYTHDLEHITIEENIAKNQLPKPQQSNENHIKEFYSLLEMKLASIENTIFTLLPATRLRNEDCIIGDDIFYRRVTENYLDNQLISNDDFNRLKECIKLYDKINHQFNYVNFNIASKQYSEYLQTLAEYRQKFSNIETTLQSIENNIQTAQETLSNPGSVVEKGSTPSSTSPTLPSSPKGYAHIQQVLAAHPVGSTVVSGQDRMILEIGKTLKIDPLEIDDALDAQTFTSEHIKNIYNIIKSRENICDVIVAGLNERTLTLDQIKNITPEILTKLSTAFARELHSKTLTSQDILQKLESFKKESETSSHITTPEMSSSASIKPPELKNP